MIQLVYFSSRNYYATVGVYQFTSYESCSRKYYEWFVLCNILVSHMIMMQYC